jgi:hypothetical protein
MPGSVRRHGLRQGRHALRPLRLLPAFSGLSGVAERNPIGRYPRHDGRRVRRGPQPVARPADRRLSRLLRRLDRRAGGGQGHSRRHLSDQDSGRRAGARHPHPFRSPWSSRRRPGC